jgi:hypothetical protein
MRKKQPQLVTDLRPTAQKPSLTRRVNKFWKNYGKIVLVVAIVLVFIGLTYGYLHTRNELNRLSNPKNAAQNDTEKVVDKVGKLIVLPSGETPTAATVSDVGKLKSQEFFSRAQNGDKVLVYAKSGRAVLYRPSINKVVEYSKVNLNTNQ